MGLQALLVLQELTEPQVQLELQVSLVETVLLAHKENQVPLLDNLEHRVRLVLQEPRVVQDQQERLVHQDEMAYQELQVHPEHRELMGRTDLLAHVQVPATLAQVRLLKYMIRVAEVTNIV